jgi:heat shock protein HtpX
MQRITLFLMTNIAVIALLSTIAGIFGLYSNGLIFMALLFGMGGSFLSLALSKWMAKRATGAQVITNPTNKVEQWLIDKVAKLAAQAGISMPEVAIYDSPDINAFATGMSRNSSLVAVSTGLLHQMDADEVEAVLAHEVSHIANGDMVTMALVQGVVNTFVIILARVVGSIADSAMRGNNNEGGVGIGYFVVSFIAEIIFGILAMPIVMWFSRYREYHADADAARLVGPNKMIAALRRLQMAHTGQLPEQLSAFGINGSKSHDIIQQLFASHPPLEDRIAKLQQIR